MSIWERGPVLNEYCECGRRFNQCPLWQEIGRIAFGGWDQEDEREAMRLQDAVTRTRHAPQLLSAYKTKTFQRQLDEYSALLGRLYTAISQVAGGRPILDSSKHPAHALVAEQLPGVDLSLIHLVRDPRAVVYSLTRYKRQVARGDGNTYVARSPPWLTSVRWTRWQLVAELAKAGSKSVVDVRYEELAQDPCEVIEALLAALGLAAQTRPASVIRGRRAEIPEQHGIGGNPMRMGGRAISINTDDEWRSQLSRRDRATASFLTAPLKWRYNASTVRERRARQSERAAADRRSNHE